MIQNYFDIAKEFMGIFISNSRKSKEKLRFLEGRGEGWGKCIYFFLLLKIGGLLEKP